MRNYLLTINSISSKHHLQDAIVGQPSAKVIQVSQLQIILFQGQVLVRPLYQPHFVVIVKPSSQIRMILSSVKDSIKRPTILPASSKRKVAQPSRRCKVMPHCLINVTSIVKFANFLIKRNICLLLTSKRPFLLVLEKFHNNQSSNSLLVQRGFRAKATYNKTKWMKVNMLRQKK